MHKNTAEGGVVTIDENIDHTRWPCVPHGPEIACAQAIIRYQNQQNGRVLRPLPVRYADYPPAAG
jgi:hypothetical protein